MIIDDDEDKVTVLVFYYEMLLISAHICVQKKQSYKNNFIPFNYFFKNSFW